MNDPVSHLGTFFSMKLYPIKIVPAKSGCIFNSVIALRNSEVTVLGIEAVDVIYVTVVGDIFKKLENVSRRSYSTLPAGLLISPPAKFRQDQQGLNPANAP